MRQAARAIAMGLANDAVNEGIASGFALAAADECRGPRDPCPMQPEPCACLYAKWRNLPWWKRMWWQQPPMPHPDTSCRQMLAMVASARKDKSDD